MTDRKLELTDSNYITLYCALNNYLRKCFEDILESPYMYPYDRDMFEKTIELYIKINKIVEDIEDEADCVCKKCQEP